MKIPHDSGRVQSDDVLISYRRLGNRGKTPVLIVHGLSYFSYDWLGVGQGLSVDREVVCMDARGFGNSSWSPKKDYSVATMARDIVVLLDHLGWKRSALVGHSMGGRATTYVAARTPARIIGLALIDYSPENASGGSNRVAQTVANTPDQFPSVEAAMAYFAHSDRDRYLEYLRPVKEGFAVKRDTYFRDQFRKLLETGERPKIGVDMWQLLGEVQCPILSMRGTRSDMYAADTVPKMKSANPGLRVVELDAGHNIAGDNPEAFLSCMRAFLAKLDDVRHRSDADDNTNIST